MAIGEEVFHCNRAYITNPFINPLYKSIYKYIYKSIQVGLFYRLRSNYSHTYTRDIRARCSDAKFGQILKYDEDKSAEAQNDEVFALAHCSDAKFGQIHLYVKERSAGACVERRGRMKNDFGQSKIREARRHQVA